MKTSRIHKILLPARHNRQGVALIIVLASLVLLALLVLAFLSNVEMELKSSKVYANGSSVKLLAQSAVNLVQSEINDATHDGSLCWTSQPGMIRTFDDTGSAVKYYKLYSDDTMVNMGVFTSSSGTPPADWYERGGVYVDLNQPVAINNVNHFPIVDGDSGDLTAYTPSTAIGSVQALTPINPDTNTPQVAGFWLKGAPVQSATTDQAPMPVKWLYVLRDGSVIVPDSSLSNGGDTTFSGANPQPDKNMKQIVGRMAFWTDDETSKVNLNTASEGAAVWDTPRFVPDYNTMAQYQPVQNEFQRYPGHPATVSLSSVFGNFITDGANPSGLSYPENIYPLTPRIAPGGSMHGTVSDSDPTLHPLALRTDRLYDTVDEFMFQKDRSLNSALLHTSNSPNHLSDSLNQAKLEQAKFFLTASSHAPDVNLFNQPRVSLWPVSSVSAALPDRSPKDQLIAFCTTVNGFPYYFQRKDSNDPATDLPATGTTSGLGRNRQLMEYLRNLMSRAIPGFGGSFAAKYNSTDTVAGSGITGKECDQILTEIFDYIRCTNLIDQSDTTTSGTPPVTTSQVTPYAAQVMPTTNYTHQADGSGQVVPIVDQSNGTRGFGRFPTLQQAALIFYASRDDGTYKQQIDANPNATPPTPQVNAVPPKAVQMTAFFVLQLFDPTMGYPLADPCYRIRITGLSNFKWDSGTAMFPSAASDPTWLPNPPVINNAVNGDMVAGGGLLGWRRFYTDDTATPSNATYGPFFSVPYPPYAADPPAPAPPTPIFPFALHTPPISEITFIGGPIKVEIFKNTPTFNPANPGTALQTISVTMPSGDFPLPKVSDPSPDPHQTPDHCVSYEDWANRWTDANDSSKEIISSNDVIRAMVPVNGDMRLIAARQTIDDTSANNFFQPHPDYADLTKIKAHSLQNSSGCMENNGSLINEGAGKLAPVNYDLGSWTWNTGWEYGGYPQMGKGTLSSDVPAANEVFAGGGTSNVPGDWDNGLPVRKDGPYINKPDEGDIIDQLALNIVAYFSPWNSQHPGQTFFSPNRMIPSPGMLGSLSTGVLENKPWQTLLFRPGPAGHPGLGSPVNSPVGPPYTTSPDYLLMDLFTMPVVEPYAISEPLATSGRINMNYQIIPFAYITRNTGIQAALKGVQVMSISDADANIYKHTSYYNPEPTPSAPYRQNIDVMKTLTQFDARFNNNDVFRSPTEICSIDLIPSNYTGADPPTRMSMDAYWSTHQATGDNSRERPYANLYPLLTTQSNTFTVHFRVQTLKKVVSPTTDYAVWQETHDLITGEYRGSQTIERYVDANNATDANGNPLPNFADPANYSKTLAPFYKFRVVSTRQFAP